MKLDILYKLLKKRGLKKCCQKILDLRMFPVLKTKEEADLI